MTLNLIVGAVTVTVVILLHELGHAAAALILGCRLESFHVWKGGVLGGPRAAIWTMQNRKHELVVALAGPAVNFGLAGLVMLAGNPAWTWANWIVGLMALAPLRGSDGWQAWRALRGQSTGINAARRPSRSFRCVLGQAREKSFQYLFGCRHPQQARSWPRTKRTREGTESYQCCMICGARIEYTGELVTN